MAFTLMVAAPPLTGRYRARFRMAAAFADNAPAVKHNDAVRHRINSSAGMSNTPIRLTSCGSTCRPLPPRSMSSPRVGCAASRNRSRSVVSSRASTAFCWLPPDKLENGARGPSARTSNCVISVAASRSIWPAPQQTEAAEAVEPVEIHVFGQRHRADAGNRVAVLGSR